MTSSSAHDCEYRALADTYRSAAENAAQEVQRLEAELAVVHAQRSQLQRHVYGRRSERMPSVNQELRSSDTASKETQRAASLEKRRENQAAKEELVEERIEYGVKAEEKLCPKCGGDVFSKVGQGKQSTAFEYIPGKLIKRVTVQETLACRCGECIITAKAPSKVVEQGKYGAGLMAHVVLRKCADHNPIYRLEKDFKRLGIALARSTMNDLFHRAALITTPLWLRLLELVAESDVVFADETPVRIQAKKKCKRGYVWTFISHLDSDAEHPTLVSYRFSKSRSGQIPAEVLGDSTGTLVADAYTGYNAVTQPEGRTRAGCLSHARRKFFDALPTAPSAQTALDLILDVYRVEHEAIAACILGTEAHAQMRSTRSRAIMEKLHAWLAEEKALHPPRSAMGAAIGYALNNWERLNVFVDDVRLPPDNNISERHLRPLALGRKNWLFVGSEELGQNLCGLQALVSTCEANSVNPWHYLKDVLERIGDHPAKHLDELLPHRWTPQADD